jgi:predicted permease
MPPVSGAGSDGTALVEGFPAGLHTYRNWCGPRYFETVGIPLIAGRDFSFQDRPGSTPVVIVNQTFARQAFGDVNPIGRRVNFGMDKGGPYEIVGVVADSHYLEIRETVVATAFQPSFQRPRPDSQFMIRTAASPQGSASAVRREVRSVLPTVTIGKVTTLTDHVDASLVQERLVAMLSSVFGAIGSLLAAIGLYGLLAYTVTRRTSEIGLRMAIGARRRDVVAMLLREALVLVAAGLAFGIPVSVSAGKLAATAVPGAPPLDSGALSTAAFLMLIVALSAAAIPALRASRIQPIDALRNE